MSVFIWSLRLTEPVDRPVFAIYSKAMGSENQTDTSARDLDRIAYAVDELVRICNRLHEENRELRAQHALLKEEQRKWRIRREQVQSKIESMVGRLRAMEQG